MVGSLDALSLRSDVISSFVRQVIGELEDFAWAPASAILVKSLYNNNGLVPATTLFILFYNDMAATRMSYPSYRQSLVATAMGVHRGTSLIRNCFPPRTTVGP